MSCERLKDGLVSSPADSSADATADVAARPPDEAGAEAETAGDAKDAGADSTTSEAAADAAETSDEAAAQADALGDARAVNDTAIENEVEATTDAAGQGAADAHGEKDAPEGGPALLAAPTVRGPLVDFNGDRFGDYGEHDLTTGAFRIYLNTGSSGTIGFAQSPMGGAVCATPSTGRLGCDVMVGDFNGDGWGEYAEHDPASGDFCIHLNQKDGTFATGTWGGGTTCTVDPSTNDGSPCEVLVADFDGDGFVDFADREPATGRVFIHFSNKDGTFGAAAPTPSFVSCADCDVMVADFTGDGTADFANRDPVNGSFSIHENLRNGTFGRLVWGFGHTCIVDAFAPMHPAPCDALVGDLNGDRLADMVAHTPSSGVMYLHPNVGPTRGTPGPWDVSEDSAPPVIDWVVCTVPRCEVLGHRIP